MGDKLAFLPSDLTELVNNLGGEINMARKLLIAIVAAAGGSIDVTWEQLGQAGLPTDLYWEDIEGGIRLTTADSEDASG